MDERREQFEKFYEFIKPIVFSMTSGKIPVANKVFNPELAHNMFIKFCQASHALGFDEYLLDHSDLQQESDIIISNAAGFNKNGEIHPLVMKYLGFDRVVIGTVTADYWKGNPQPRIKRFIDTESLVNWMGLPGEGVNKIAQRIIAYEKHNIPLTINFMSTPKKDEGKTLEDLETTLSMIHELDNVDRFELNISCPNTHNSSGEIDNRNAYQKQLENMLLITDQYSVIEGFKEVYIKLSPDLDEQGVKEILEVSQHHRVAGYVIGNTTTNHNEKYIPISPGKGGASGNADYNRAFETQKMLHKLLDERGIHKKIISCAGINSRERVKERIQYSGFSKDKPEIQIYTPFVFQGPELLRELKKTN